MKLWGVKLKLYYQQNTLFKMNYFPFKKMKLFILKFTRSAFMRLTLKNNLFMCRLREENMHDMLGLLRYWFFY